MASVRPDSTQRNGSGSEQRPAFDADRGCFKQLQEGGVSSSGVVFDKHSALNSKSCKRFFADSAFHSFQKQLARGGTYRLAEGTLYAAEASGRFCGRAHSCG